MDSRYPPLGGAFAAIHDNLDDLDRRQTRLLECRLYHLDEWARTAALSSEGRDALLQMLDALRPARETPLPADMPAENRDAVRHHARALSVPERLMLLRALPPRQEHELFADLTAESLELSERALGKIAYVQNAYSDNAYLQLSRELIRPRAAYFDSFSDVCEEVYNGICEYGILPIFHERDGKLFRFYALLEKYDLRIVCACDVPCIERDGVTVTRYALIRKTLPAVRDGAATHMELILPAEDGGDLCDLLQAARECGLLPLRLDTRPAGDDSGRLTHQVTLSVPREEISVFLTFLSLELPRCTVLGIYHLPRVQPTQ